jgi:beta-mannosidase
MKWAAAAAVLASALALPSRAQTPQPAPTTVWPIRLEEPTGIERRDGEAVTVSVAFVPGQAREGWLRVVDDSAREVALQVHVFERHGDGSLARAQILFPATLVPGARPVFTLISAPRFARDTAPRPRRDAPAQTVGGGYRTDLIVRRIGTSRLELGNSRFGVLVNLGRDATEPAIVEAYNRSAGDQRVLNLVETTPDHDEPLGVGVRSAGWGTAIAGAQRTTGFTTIEVIDSGPLRAVVRLSGARFGGATERWEFEWTAASPVLVWRARATGGRARYGFFVSAVSAAPYEPFTRWIDASESRWPSGPDTDTPPDHPIAGATFDDLPGGAVTYYDPARNYGALTFLEIDPALGWEGIGGRQFTATKPAAGAAGQDASIGIAFPEWTGTETGLAARALRRVVVNPIVAQVGEPETRAAVPDMAPAPREPTYERWQESRAVPSPAPGGAPALSLDGEWRLHDAAKGEGERLGWQQAAVDDREWRKVTVPGSVHLQVLGLPAAFTPAANWVSTREWWFRRRFRVPAGFPVEHARLRFGATDYYADVWVNGRRAGSHEGYVDPWEIDVASLLRPGGDNVIAVRVWTPVSYYWRHRPYTVKGSYGAVDQKPDDITPLGITRPVSLVGFGPVRLAEIGVWTTLNADGSADVDVDVGLAADGADDIEDENAALDLSLEPRNFEGTERLRIRVPLVDPAIRSTGRASARFHLETPALWWTRDHGKPNLYSLAARLTVGGRVSDSRVQAVGVREIEKVGWVFYLNGRRLFIRGTNSYYLSLFLSELTPAQYARDLGTMADMNINMVRLHCHFQNPEFYDTADELGLLVWQDYLEAWYPHDPDFALHAARLYDAHIRLVRNHPSVAIWATSDEEDLDNYRVLTKHLAGRLFLEDPQHRAVVRSTGRYGDGHVYEGWYGGTIWAYTQTEEAFISELGATALPNYESLVRFLPNHWPIEQHADDWVFHKLQIDEAMRAWGPPGALTLREYIPRTQGYVARLHQLAIERMRRRKYAAGGILHFHAIDFWPSVTMAAVDYYRVPTKSYDTVRRSFQLVLASVAYDRDTLARGVPVRFPLWAINDRWDGFAATVAWRVRDASGRTTAEGRQPVEFAPDSAAPIGEVTWTPATTGAIELWTEVIGADGRQLSENRYEFTVTGGP